MIKVSVLYPNPEDCRFDFDYYCRHHLDLVRTRLGDACHGIAVDQVVGGEPGPRPAFVAVCHLYFESVAAFEAAFAPHEADIMSDIPNYTNVSPIVLVSEVRVNATRSQTGELRHH